MSNWLSEEYQIAAFTNADEMLGALKVAQPDLIILDYEMPGMNGYDLMVNLKNKPETEHIPVIFLTGKNDKDLVVSVLEYKPYSYLLKSSPKEALKQRIERCFLEKQFQKPDGKMTE